jgi:hypothetical protein
MPLFGFLHNNKIAVNEKIQAKRNGRMKENTDRYVFSALFFLVNSFGFSVGSCLE